MNKSVEMLIVDGYACNDETFIVLDLSSFVNLRVFEVGNDCFENVVEVKLIGLHTLERVVIGKKSFTKSADYNPNRHFYLKDCEQLKVLKLDRGSFMDYSVCEIANVPSLEVVEVGALNEWSCNFYYASLELKSELVEEG